MVNGLFADEAETFGGAGEAVVEGVVELEGVLAAGVFFLGAIMGLLRDQLRLWKLVRFRRSWW